MRILLSIFAILFAFIQPAVAGSINYDIVKDKSLVGFTYQYGSDEIEGQFIDYNADISIDFEQASKSHVDVTLGTDTAKAGFAFATQALRSKKVLDASQFPDIKFVSNSVRASGNGALIDGMVTVRGVTKPLTLSAQLLRDPGTEATERDDLRIRLSGNLNRHDFGASGYPNDVGETLGIQIDARIKRK